MTDSLFVVTGGPGSGKTSLVRALADQGIRHKPEAGRAIIQDQKAIGGVALPWRDRATFAEMMLAWDMRSYREAWEEPGPVIFDRGIPDVIGYLVHCKLPIPDHVRRAADLCRYNRRVFLAPYWPAIYLQDEERRQLPEEAAATCAAMREVYQSLGYELVPLPLISLTGRASFVRARIAEWS